MSPFFNDCLVLINRIPNPFKNAESGAHCKRPMSGLLDSKGTPANGRDLKLRQQLVRRQLSASVSQLDDL